MKWTRKTKEFQYAPYESEDGKYIVADMSMSSGRAFVPEYARLRRNSPNSAYDRTAFLNYCKEHKINIYGANWVLVNNETKEVKFPFKTAKAAKEYAESI